MPLGLNPSGHVSELEVSVLVDTSLQQDWPSVSQALVHIEVKSNSAHSSTKS